MAKPRIFVSSTYIDLKHARKHIESFIKSVGYETVLFESGDITFHHDMLIDESCYAEIDTCHMLILIIGGKYGSPSSEHADDIEKIQNKEILFYNSITKKEYITAREKNIPIFIFVEKGVHSEYQTYKKNRENIDIKYAHVDNVNIFKLLEDIISQRANNYVRSFENFEDITSWLKDQWAGMFADFLSKKNSDSNIVSLQNQISELNAVTQSLKIYNEQLLKSLSPAESSSIIETEDKKLLARKMVRFSKNILIRHLNSVTKNDSSLKEMYDTFTKTANFADFMKELSIPDEEYNFLVSNRVPLSDYLKLRNTFLDEENIIDEEE
jgi:hypothetical protein